MDELIKGVKIGKIIGKEEKKSDVVKIVGIVLGVLAVVAAIAGRLAAEHHLPIHRRLPLPESPQIRCSRSTT